MIQIKLCHRRRLQGLLFRSVNESVALGDFEA